MAWLYKLRVYLITTTAAVLILLAVVFTALRAVLPYATDYVAEIQQELSNQIGLPVAINTIDADMSWFTPRLKLIGLTIYEKDGEKELLRLDQAIFALSYIDSLLDMSPVVGEIFLVGADLYIERHPGGRWIFQGIEYIEEGTSEMSNELLNAVQNTNFSLLDSDLHWKDFTNKTESMDFIGVNLVFETFLGEHSLALDMKLPEAYGDSFYFIASVNDDLSKAKNAEWDIYFEGRTINAKNWLSRLDFPLAPDVDGTFDGKLWLHVKNREVVRVSGDVSVNNLDLTHKKNKNKKWDASHLASRFDWHRGQYGWSFNVGDLSLVKNNQVWMSDSDISVFNSSAKGTDVSISYIKPADLFELGDLFLAEEDLPKLAKAKSMYLGGDLYNIVLHLPHESMEQASASAVFSNVDLNLEDAGIVVKGIDGQFKYKEDRLELNLLTTFAQIDFGDLFPQPLDVELLAGSVAAFQVDNEWSVESSDIRLINADIETRSRLKANIDAKGEVFVDMQSNFKNAKGSSVRKYYPLTAMSKDLVEWLNMAITDGDVPSGSFILHGKAGNFPFPENDGVMEVVFHNENLNLKFYEGWPAINNLSGDVRFYNSSLTVENGRGKTYAGLLRNAKATIPDLNAPWLYVDGFIEAPARDLQEYVWNSGLNDILGNAMNQFSVSGDVDLELALEISLEDNDDTIRTNGKLNFTNNEILFPVMEYRLTDVNGLLQFNEKSMNGENIKALFEGVPVNINVSETEYQFKPETRFHITGRLPVDGLLKRFDWLPEYWFDGSSDWNVFVHLPQVTDDYLARIELLSSLEGVDVQISDAIKKVRQDKMSFEMIVDIMEAGIQMDFTSKDIFSLFANRDNDANWNFAVDSRLIKGKGSFDEELDRNSKVKLRLDHANLHELFYSSDETKKQVALKPTTFPSLNVSVKNLSWENWKFNNVKLGTSWNTHGMLINKLSLQGPSLDVKGQGSWLVSWNDRHETNFKFYVNSSDLGHTMSSLKLGDSINRSKHVATVNWQWAAEPYRFSLGSVNGTAHFELTEGEVKDLKPGAGGRLLGLFNVFKLGDRLTLNFNDVYKEGFSFDSVVGDFRFDEGDVYTSNVEVEAPAADMKINGRIGIVERDYDLTMLVKPKLSESVFTTGTLYGGPGLGAALVVLNKVLGIEDYSRDKYEVTGSWENPDIKLVSKREERKDAETGLENDDTSEEDDEFAE